MYKPYSFQVSDQSASVEEKKGGKWGKTGYCVGGVATIIGAMGTLVNYVRLLDIEEKLRHTAGYSDWYKTLPRESVKDGLERFQGLHQLYSLLLERLNILDLIYLCGLFALLGIGIIAGTYIVKKYGKPKIVFEKGPL